LRRQRRKQSPRPGRGGGHYPLLTRSCLRRRKKEVHEKREEGGKKASKTRLVRLSGGRELESCFFFLVPEERGKEGKKEGGGRSERCNFLCGERTKEEPTTGLPCPGNMQEEKREKAFNPTPQSERVTRSKNVPYGGRGRGEKRGKKKDSQRIMYSPLFEGGRHISFLLTKGVIKKGGGVMRTQRAPRVEVTHTLSLLDKGGRRKKRAAFS